MSVLNAKNDSFNNFLLFEREIKVLVKVIIMMNERLFKPIYFTREDPRVATKISTYVY